MPTHIWFTICTDKFCFPLIASDSEKTPIQNNLSLDGDSSASTTRKNSSTPIRYGHLTFSTALSLSGFKNSIVYVCRVELLHRILHIEEIILYACFFDNNNLHLGHYYQSMVPVCPIDLLACILGDFCCSLFNLGISVIKASFGRVHSIPLSSNITMFQ